MPQRVFTVELTEDEAETVWRMAELSGIPAGQIVRNLHRSNAFRMAVSLATREWEFWEDDATKGAPDPEKQRSQFRFWAADLLGLDRRGL